MARIKVFRRKCDICGKDVNRLNGIIKKVHTGIEEGFFGPSTVHRIRLDMCYPCLRKTTRLEIVDYDKKLVRIRKDG